MLILCRIDSSFHEVKIRWCVVMIMIILVAFLIWLWVRKKRDPYRRVKERK
jgi:hypothetical protein